MLNIILLILCIIIFAYCIYLTVNRVGNEPKYCGEAFIKEIEEDGIPYQTWQLAISPEVMSKIKDGEQIAITVHKE